MTIRLNEYHWQNGLYFLRRESDGAVEVRIERNDLPSELLFVIPFAEWASIVAHVAIGGEALNYEGATLLHAGHLGRELERQRTNWREFAQLFASKDADGMLTISGKMGRIPAQSFPELYAHAKEEPAASAPEPNG